VVLEFLSMKMFANPAAMQLLGLMMLLAGLLLVTALLVRSMRRQMTTQQSLAAPSPRTETTKFETAAYQGVISELKEREKALQSQLGIELRRFAALETLHKSMLENIATGVMLFNSSLMVQQANPSARKILGFASPMSMHVKEVFSGLEAVELPSSNGALGGISQAVREVLATGKDYREIPACFRTPSGKLRNLRLTLLPYRDGSQLVVGVFCLLEGAGQGFTLSLQARSASKTSLEPE
jgi:PAS domain-containing protein